MRSLWIPDLNDGRDYLSGYPHSVASVVSNDVVDYYSEKRCQRSGITACVGSETVQNGLDVAPQVAERDGQARPTFTDWQD